MTQVTAAVTPALDAEAVIQTLTLDAPRAGEVRVRMVASGVCHTDVAVRDGWIPTTFPIVLGHEGAGVVEELGEGVTHLAVGDHVVLSVASCGTCRQCLIGHMAFCENSYVQNFAGGRADGSRSLTDADGASVNSHFFGQSSFSSAANVPVRSVVKVRSDVPLETVAPLGCGIQTGAGTVLNVLKPHAESTLVVFGAGAVGLAAVLAAVVAGVQRIVVVDIVESRLALAKELGATDAVNGRAEDTAARLAEISGTGVDYALDTTGNPGVLETMIASLGHRGHAALIGAAHPDARVSFSPAIALARSIRLTNVVEGDAQPQLFVPELIELWRAGRFPFDRLVKHYPFAEIATAFADSESGEVIKPVVTF